MPFSSSSSAEDEAVSSFLAHPAKTAPAPNTPAAVTNDRRDIPDPHARASALLRIAIPLYSDMHSPNAHQDTGFSQEQP